MKISQGHVAVTGGSNQITGTGVDWRSVRPGYFLCVAGLIEAFQIHRACEHTLVLHRPVAELPTGYRFSGMSYEISNEFSPRWQMPLPSQHDKNQLDSINRFLKIADGFADDLL